MLLVVDFADYFLGARQVMAEAVVNSEEVLSMQGLSLKDLVELRLNERHKFSHIAADLGLGRNDLTRMLNAEGWEGVYHHVPFNQLKEIILQEVPLLRAGSNWGIRSVQAMLRHRKLRVPRALIREALSQLQPQHMERCQVGRLFRGQYTITKPMLLWHMDCKHGAQTRFLYFPDVHVHLILFFLSFFVFHNIILFANVVHFSILHCTWDEPSL